MRYGSGYSDSGKSKLIGFIVFGVFIVIFFVFAYFMTQTMRNSVSQNSQYLQGRQNVQLTEKDGKKVISDDLLKYDYTYYAESHNSGTSSFNNMTNVFLGIFAAISLGLVIGGIVRLVMKKENLVGSLILLISGILFFLPSAGMLVGLNVIFKSAKVTDPAKAQLRTELVHIDSTEVTSSTHRNGKGHSKTTSYNYYIHLDNGDRISVSRNVYDMISSTGGDYYLGKNDQDRVFAAYSADEFTLS